MFWHLVKFFWFFIQCLLTARYDVSWCIVRLLSLSGSLPESKSDYIKEGNKNKIKMEMKIRMRMGIIKMKECSEIATHKIKPHVWMDSAWAGARSCGLYAMACSGSSYTQPKYSPGHITLPCMIDGWRKNRQCWLISHAGRSSKWPSSIHTSST